MNEVFQKGRILINRFINIKMGLTGAFIMGGIVWFINIGFGESSSRY